MKSAAFVDDCQSLTECHHSKELTECHHSKELTECHHSKEISNTNKSINFYKILKIFTKSFQKLQRSQSKHMKKHNVGKNT